jgi:hypothetical protein
MFCKGRAETVDYLLSKGPNPNTFLQGDKAPPILKAIEKAHLGVVKRLLQDKTTEEFAKIIYNYF